MTRLLPFDGARRFLFARVFAVLFAKNCTSCRSDTAQDTRGPLKSSSFASFGQDGPGRRTGSGLSRIAERGLPDCRIPLTFLREKKQDKKPITNMVVTGAAAVFANQVEHQGTFICTCRRHQGLHDDGIRAPRLPAVRELSALEPSPRDFSSSTGPLELPSSAYGGKNKPLGIHPRSPRSQPSPPQPAKQGTWTPAWDHPTTRAGVRDYVS